MIFLIMLMFGSGQEQIFSVKQKTLAIYKYLTKKRSECYRNAFLWKYKQRQLNKKNHTSHTVLGKINSKML